MGGALIEERRDDSCLNLNKFASAEIRQPHQERRFAVCPNNRRGAETELGNGPRKAREEQPSSQRIHEETDERLRDNENI